MDESSSGVRLDTSISRTFLPRCSMNRIRSSMGHSQERHLKTTPETNPSAQGLRTPPRDEKQVTAAGWEMQLGYWTCFYSSWRPVPLQLSAVAVPIPGALFQ